MSARVFGAILGSAMLLVGCASVPEGAGQTPSDPWEKVNRQTHAFNTVVDEYAIRPVAQGYIKVVPQGVRESVDNALGNILEPKNAVNNALQGKGEGALVSVFRFLINTTFGLGGLFDVAGTVGQQPVQEEDFGQTLQVWGVPRGPYVVLPFMGPSTVTDATGSVVGWYSTPVAYAENDWLRWGVTATSGVAMRAKAMPLTDQLRTAVDPYVMAREGYLASRRNAVYDGNPPLELTKDEFEDEDEPAATTNKE